MGDRSKGRPREYADRVTTAVRLPIDLHRRLAEEAEARDTSINHLLVRAATYYLDHMLPPLGPEISPRNDDLGLEADRG